MRTAFLIGLLAPLTLTPLHAQEQRDPPWETADGVYGPEAMREARRRVQDENGDIRYGLAMIDRLEWQDTGGDGTLAWDVQAYYGGDINKVWVKSEGDYSLTDDDVEEAEVQLLYSRAISPYFDLQTGIRQDLEPDGLSHAVLGIQGLAPYWFETDAALFLSEEGDMTGRVEAEVEWFLTQRLILQPRLEAGLSAQSIEERDLGAGLTDVSLGARLRYEVKRSFAPYVGAEWRSRFGETADLQERLGQETDEVVFVAGLRAWF